MNPPRNSAHHSQADATILVVDDESDVLELVSTSLRRSGYEVIEADNGALALEKARAVLPEAIVLDIMLPDLSGLDVCRTLKYDTTTAHIPIIMLTARSEEIDRIVGLELGADDYLCKPFSPRELDLRVRNIIRREQRAPLHREQVEAAGLIVNRAQMTVTYNGRFIELTATEFKLLGILLDRRGRVQPREALMRDVLGYQTTGDSRTVDSHIRRLRDKLGSAAHLIETIRGFGYRISAESDV